MNFLLWVTPDKWISDPFGYVFLPRAMLEIGKAIFLDEWTGKEIMAKIMDEQEAEQRCNAAAMEAEDQRRKEAVEKARRAAPVWIGGRRSKPLRQIGNRWNDPQAGDSLSALQASKVNTTWENAAQREAALQRYARVCTKVVGGCQSGELVSGYRPKEGGDVRTIPNAWWNTEGFALEKRFAFCSLDPTRPFLAGWTANEAWICVSRDSLDAFLDRLGPSHVSTIKDESDAIRYLTIKVKQDPDLRRGDAEADCCERFEISQRGFRDRVWPKAREGAGLSAIAPPGRKKRKNA